MSTPPPGPAYRTLGLTVPVTEALNPKLWRERYAFGITLGTGEQPTAQDAISKLLGCSSARGLPRTATGKQIAEANATIQDAVKTIPDAVIGWFLRAAMSELEFRIGVPMGVVVYKSDPLDPGIVQGVDFDVKVPRKDFTRDNQLNFYRTDLPAGTISIERIRAYWFDQPVWSISEADGNADLIRFDRPGIAGAHIMPTQSATLLVAMPALGTAAYGSLQLIFGFPSPLPSVWAVDYTVGPRNRYGQIGAIPAVVAHWIYCRAGVFLLSIGGRAAARGLTNASLSIDGLSKSVGLAGAGAINKALEDRLTEATKSLDIPALQIQMRGLRVVGYGS